MLLQQMLHNSSFSAHFQAPQLKHFFHLNQDLAFLLNLASAVTKAKRLNRQGAKQREVRAGVVSLLGLQLHRSQDTLLVCSVQMFVQSPLQQSHCEWFILLSFHRILIVTFFLLSIQTLDHQIVSLFHVILILKTTCSCMIIYLHSIL